MLTLMHDNSSNYALSPATAVLQPSSEQLRSWALAGAISPQTLSLIILPTEKCNFRCTYCYETFEIGRMSRETVDAVKRLIASRMNDLEYLTLSWFGGEPLVAADIVLEICEFAAEQCAAHGVTFLNGSTTTNGALLDETLLQRLVALKQTHFQISLDGWREGHDMTRRAGNGGGTFESVWRALLMMRDTTLDFNVLLRIHLTRSNRDSLLALADNVVKEFGTDRRFAPFLKAIENMGGPHSSEIQTLSRHGRTSLMEELETIFRVMTGEQTQDAQEGGADICYASKPNNLIIRANGRLAKCTVHFDDPRNDVGALRTDGTLEIDNTKLAYWFRGLYGMDEEVLGCPAWVRPYEKLASDAKVIRIAAQ